MQIWLVKYMNKRFTYLLYYLFQFIMAMTTLGFILLFLLKVTILSPNYVIKKFEKNNYYTELNKDIKNEMSYYIGQSGFEEEILDNLYTDNELKYVVDNFIKNFYKGLSLDANKVNVENKLRININNYINNRVIEVGNQKDLDKFITEMGNIYENKITYSKMFNKYSWMVKKINYYINIILVIAIIFIVMLYIVIKYGLKKNVFAISLLTTGVIIGLILYYLGGMVLIDDLYLFNSYSSIVIKDILNSMFKIFSTVSIVCLIFGTLLAIINTDYWLDKKTKKKLSRK